MPTRPTLKPAAALALLLVFLLGAVAVQSQQRRRRTPSRRATAPAAAPDYAPAPSQTPGEPRLVSTAEEAAQEDPGAGPRERRNRQTPGEQQQQQDAATRRAIEQLSTEITSLNRKVETMERERRVDVLQERVTRAEQRVEGLQQQLRDVMSKEADLQLRLDQIDEQMRPENLERQTAVVGSFRPDELRDSLRRQLDNEKKRVRSQLDLYASSRAQLENSLNTAQQFAERLRGQLEEATRRESEEAEAGGPTAAPARTNALPRTAAPSPTPPPPM